MVGMLERPLPVQVFPVLLDCKPEKSQGSNGRVWVKAKGRVVSVHCAASACTRPRARGEVGMEKVGRGSALKDLEEGEKKT